MKPASQTKPRLLMISHCLPEPCGDHHSARAWQLLQLAQGSHEVDLACSVHGSVNLQQWRTAASASHRLSMDTAALPLRLAGSVTGLFNASAATQWQWCHSLSSQIQSWHDQLGRFDQQYDKVICTHPALWQVAQAVNAAQHICDMDAAISSMAMDHTAGMFTQRIMRNQQQLNQAVARECDVMTTSHETMCDTLASQAKCMYHLPRAVDMNWFAQHTGGQSASDINASPLLMLHADERQRSGKAIWAWFARHVWQKVQQAVPNAQWARPILRGHQTFDSLRQASVIVSPLDDPDQGQWAALQSMAVGRPLIASSSAVASLGVRHGEHLLMSHKPADWVELCVESLRNASVRLKLAHAGRAFVQSHCPSVSSHNLFTPARLKSPGVLPTGARTIMPPVAMAA